MDSCLSNKKLIIKHLSSSRELEVSLQKVTTHYNTQSGKEGKVAVLYGVSHFVKDEMWECLIIHMKGSGTKVQIPREGQPQSCTTELFNVICCVC